MSGFKQFYVCRAQGHDRTTYQKLMRAQTGTARWKFTGLPAKSRASQQTAVATEGGNVNTLAPTNIRTLKRVSIDHHPEGVGWDDKARHVCNTNTFAIRQPRCKMAAQAQ